MWNRPKRPPKDVEWSNDLKKNFKIAQSSTCALLAAQKLTHLCQNNQKEVYTVCSTHYTVYKDFLFKSQMYKVGCQKAFGSIHLRVQTRLVPLTELIWAERVPGADSDYLAFSCSVSERVSDKAIYRVVFGKLKKRLRRRVWTASHFGFQCPRLDCLGLDTITFVFFCF